MEVFHSLLSKYSPEGQHSFNACHGAYWNYLKKKTGKVKMSQQYPKLSVEWVSKLVKVQKQREYLPKIMNLVVGVKAN